MRNAPIVKDGAASRRRIRRLLSVCGILFFVILNPVDTLAVELDLTASEKACLAAHPRIRLTPDPDVPPIEYFRDGQFFGIAADNARLIEQKLGIKFEIREVASYLTSVKETKAREKDVWSAVAVTPGRQKFMVFSAPYIDSPAVIVVRDTTT